MTMIMFRFLVIASLYLVLFICQGQPYQCKKWCPKHQKPWTTKCQWNDCAACWKCNNDNSPGIKTFQDITMYMSETENNWDSNDLLHSFKPSDFYYSPAFPDWDNDGYLDYVYPNHIRYSINDWDFGLNVPSSSSDPSTTTGGRSFRAINTETILNDIEADGGRRDIHEITFADMDKDGILDLLVTGGMDGLGFGANLDNRLFWGKVSEDGITTTTFLEGGRQTAETAGIECRNCRGLFMYVTDADRDGLLDVMSMTRVRIDNIISPGVMQLNHGNRTFSKDSDMEEYAKAIILTDADGDGYAQEFVVFRTPCFRDEDYGDYSKEYKTFCNQRPYKTNAIYKYMGGEEEGESRKMTLISPKYRRYQYQNKGQNKGVVMDAATGDFDFDQKADLAVLFTDKLIFYYSSDRKRGDLPLYNEDDLEEQNDDTSFVQMELPCTGPARTIRFADLDNDGYVEMVLGCRDAGEIFVFKLKRNTRTWVVDTKWNLGDLVNTQQWLPTSEDLQAACRDDVACNEDACREDNTDMAVFVNYWSDHCRSYKESGQPSNKPTTTGLKTFSLIDLNNDGFLDVVAAHKNGYQRFFLNIPKTTPMNRFIRFELKCTSSNVYAIGTTLIFKASGLKLQFLEISNYGQGNAGNGQVDDRIVFGLGKTAIPIRLTLRWPTGKKQIVDLSEISETHISNFANPVVVTEEV